MADMFTLERRSAMMTLVRSSCNASTGQKLAGLFRARGVTDWCRRVPLLGKPDFVFRAEKFVVVVDGCFYPR